MFSFEQFTDQVSTPVGACSWGLDRLDTFWRTPAGQLGLAAGRLLLGIGTAGRLLA